MEDLDNAEDADAQRARDDWQAARLLDPPGTVTCAGPSWSREYVDRLREEDSQAAEEAFQQPVERRRGGRRDPRNGTLLRPRSSSQVIGTCG